MSKTDFTWEDFNPDAMSVEDLRLYELHLRVSDLDWLAIHFLPTSGVESVRISMAQAHEILIEIWLYCVLKLRAMKYRLEAQIQYAIVCEKSCEKIYKSLPQSLRW